MKRLVGDEDPIENQWSPDPGINNYKGFRGEMPNFLRGLWSKNKWIQTFSPERVGKGTTHQRNQETAGLEHRTLASKPPWNPCKPNTPCLHISYLAGWRWGCSPFHRIYVARIQLWLATSSVVLDLALRLHREWFSLPPSKTGFFLLGTTPAPAFWGNTQHILSWTPVQVWRISQA